MLLNVYIKKMKLHCTNYNCSLCRSWKPVSQCTSISDDAGLSIYYCQCKCQCQS